MKRNLFAVLAVLFITGIASGQSAFRGIFDPMAAETGGLNSLKVNPAGLHDGTEKKYRFQIPILQPSVISSTDDSPSGQLALDYFNFGIQRGRFGLSLDAQFGSVLDMTMFDLSAAIGYGSRIKGMNGAFLFGATLKAQSYFESSVPVGDSPEGSADIEYWQVETSPGIIVDFGRILPFLSFLYGGISVPVALWKDDGTDIIVTMEAGIPVMGLYFEQTVGSESTVFYGGFDSFDGLDDYRVVAGLAFKDGSVVEKFAFQYDGLLQIGCMLGGSGNFNVALSGGFDPVAPRNGNVAFAVKWGWNL